MWSFFEICLFEISAQVEGKAITVLGSYFLSSCGHFTQLEDTKQLLFVAFCGFFASRFSGKKNLNLEMDGFAHPEIWCKTGRKVNLRSSRIPSVRQKQEQGWISCPARNFETRVALAQRNSWFWRSPRHGLMLGWPHSREMADQKVMKNEWKRAHPRL